MDGADLTDQVLAESFTELSQASLTQIQVAMRFYVGSRRFVLHRELDAAREPFSGLPLDTLSAPSGSRTISRRPCSRIWLRFMPDPHVERLLAYGGAGRNERHCVDSQYH